MSTTARIPVSIECVGTFSAEVERVYAAIMARAHEYFVDRGSVQGIDADDWLRAERELITKPEFELLSEDHDFVVVMTLPHADIRGLEIHLTPKEMLVSSETDNTGRRIFRVVHFPDTISFSSVDAEVVGDKLRVVAAIASEAERRRYSHFA